MAAFENVQGITKIEFKGKFRAFCPLGKAFYSGDVYVTVENPTMVPDYCEVDNLFKKIDGSEIIIEDAVAKVYDWVSCVTDAAHVKVECTVTDAAHLPVIVTKEGVHDE